MLATSMALANEAPKNQFDRSDYSWGFRSPGETQVRQRQLLIWCQKNPEKCSDKEYMLEINASANASAGGGAGGVGTGLGEATAIGNQNVIVVEGDNNTINFEADQTNDGTTVSVDQNISDNELDINIDSNSQFVNEVKGDVVNTTTTTTTTDNSIHNQKYVDIEVHDIDLTKPCCVK